MCLKTKRARWNCRSCPWCRWRPGTGSIPQPHRQAHRSDVSWRRDRYHRPRPRPGAVAILGSALRVDNRPGGDETLGIEATAKSSPDGYTLVLSSNGGITAAPHLHTHIRYDSQKDLTPIYMLGQVTPVMVVAGLLTGAIGAGPDRAGQVEARRTQLRFVRHGSYSHVAMEDFKQRTGTQMMHLPYRGAAPAYTALLRNETAVMIANLSGATGHAEAGTVRIIAGPVRIGRKCGLIFRRSRNPVSRVSRPAHGGDCSGPPICRVRSSTR